MVRDKKPCLNLVAYEFYHIAFYFNIYFDTNYATGIKPWLLISPRQVLVVGIFKFVIKMRNLSAQ
jgi:hypothetical protein